MSSLRRWALMVVALIGGALIVMPFAFDMFSAAPKGAVMMAQFKPFMTTQRLDGNGTHSYLGSGLPAGSAGTG